jgi:hypothetical protein
LSINDSSQISDKKAKEKLIEKSKELKEKTKQI